MQPNSKYQVQPNANPYAAPIVLDRRTGKPLGFSGGGMSAEKIRRENAHDEATLHYYGYYHVICGVIMVLVGVIALGALFFFRDSIPRLKGSEGEISSFYVVVIGVTMSLVLAIGAFRLAIGLGLTKFTRLGLVGGKIIHVMGLIVLPFDTALSIYFLILTSSEKGKKLFSPEYRAVIDTTPNVRLPFPIFGWLFLGYFVATVGLMVIAFIFTKGYFQWD